MPVSTEYAGWPISNMGNDSPVRRAISAAVSLELFSRVASHFGSSINAIAVSRQFETVAATCSGVCWPSDGAFTSAPCSSTNAAASAFDHFTAE